MLHALRRWSLGALVAAVLGLSSREARAVRPFITDDARVVGPHSAQAETWVRFDRAQVQHWVLAGFGPVGPLELTVGAVHGAHFGDPMQGPVYGASGPVGQLKLLLLEGRPNGLPGLAWVAGALAPVGYGPFATRGWDLFEYLAVSSSLGRDDQVLLHANVGVFGSTDPQHTPVALTWGVGTQVRLYRGLHAVAELFSGDPYLGSSGGATQFGLRWVLSHAVQLDATAGLGLWGAEVMPPWGSVGFRVASEPLWGRPSARTGLVR